MKLLLILVGVLVCGFAGNDCKRLPVANCPKGEHSVFYCPQRAEPSCDNPKIHDLVPDGLCDIPQCFCDVPTVRNAKTSKCVSIKDC